jgi:putative flippase GtrA
VLSKVAGGQPVRFLIAGGVNTLFGIADTFVMLHVGLLLVPGHPKAMGTAAMALSSIVNIGFSFLTYKWFVFRTRGHYGPEFLRSLTIYLPSLALNTLMVAPLTAVLERWVGPGRGAVYLAMASILSFTIVFSFFGHKRVTFRQRTS